MPTRPLTLTSRELEADNRELRARLEEAEDTLRAIRSGEVDALVVSGSAGEQLFTLQGADRSYRTLIEQMNEGALTVTVDGSILYANQRFASMLNAPLEKVIGSSIQAWVVPESQAALRALLNLEVAETRRTELTLNSSFGSSVPVYLSVNRLPADDLPRTLGIVATDLTERKQTEAEIRRLNQSLEQRVHSRTAQLEAANKELEAFSYSVSHELRAPLGVIEGLARTITDGYASQLPQSALDYLFMVRENAGQMRVLLDDLLALSRFSRHAISLQEVEPALIVHRVIAELRPEHEDRQILFTVGGPGADTDEALPRCMADPVLLKQVFRNLIANAVKFTRPREVATIEIASMEAGGEHVYYVRDNGVGFDMKFASRLFGVFQRMHSDTEFEGTGVGLAIVQRIVRLHGGRIWVEAQPGKGATFFFTLPGP